MHYKLMFPNDYLAACDLQGKDVTVRIESIKIEDLKGSDGSTETKPIIRFAGKKKKLVLNKTNAKSIAKLHGKDTDDWIGKDIVVYPTTCNAFGDVHECIRVR